MVRIYVFLICSILLCCVNSSFGQQVTDTVETAADSVVIEKSPKAPLDFYYPTSIKLGVDLAAIGTSLLSDKREVYEFQADIDFHRLYLAGSFGKASYELNEETFTYRNDGTFFRIGADVSFLKFDPDYNTLTVGLRYARSSFDESMTVNGTDPVFGNFTDEQTNSGVSAQWFELTSGLRVEMFKNIYMGYTFRIKLNRKIKDASNFRSYETPGFGLSQFKNRWSFHYYVMYRIAWKEKKILKR